MRKVDLCLHSGGTRVHTDQLAMVETPAATETWQPIPHANLLTQVKTELIKSSLSIVHESHALARDGQRYFGLLQVVVNGQERDDFSLVVGVRNSHDKSFPAGLVLGASVFICDNLAFSGEVKLARKHTTHINRDLPMLVNRAVARLADHRQKQEQRYLSYQQAEMTDAVAHDLIIRGLDNEVIGPMSVEGVLNEWRNPRHAEFRTIGKTGWRLFNAFTETMKDSSLTTLPKRTQGLHGILDAYCGLLLPAITQEEETEEPRPVIAG